MSEDLLRLQFDILSRRIGSEVSCKVWESGKEKNLYWSFSRCCTF